MSDVFDDDDEPTGTASTATAVDDDDMFDDDLDVDFDKVDLPETDLPFLINEVIYEKKMAQDQSKKNYMVTIKMKVDGNDYDFLAPYDGRFHTETIFIGDSIKGMNPYGVKRLQAFLHAATGVKPEGPIVWKQYGFVRDEGTERGKLTYLHGNSVGGSMVKETGTDKVERLKVKVWKDAENLKPLSPEELAASADF